MFEVFPDVDIHITLNKRLRREAHPSKFGESIMQAQFQELEKSDILSLTSPPKQKHTKKQNQKKKSIKK